MYDLAIIGGGPAGYNAAHKAAVNGLSVILFEKSELGGVCLNEGCIPTKTLLYSAKLYEHAALSQKYGIFSEGVTADYGKIADRKDKVVKKLVGGVRVKMRDSGVEVVKQEAFICGSTAGGFALKAGDQDYEARNLLLCTGSSAVVPPIPGVSEAGETIVTARELLSFRERPESLVIIGGGVIGMEFASFFNSLGTKVAVVEMLPEILGGMDSEQAAMLRGAYAKKGVEFHLGCKVSEIKGGEVCFTDPEGQTMSVTGDKILLSTGRRPNTKGFGLENIGVKAGRGVEVDDHMRTNVPGVYAAGDITGFSMLAHTAVREGEVAVDNILGKDERMEYNAIPGVVYTNPEMAGAGLTEENAPDCSVLKLPMAYSGRFVAENERGEGQCKIVFDPQTRLVKGVHMLGNSSSEIIQSACIAISQDITVDNLYKVVFPHPTVSEILKETLGLECH
ncbi:MAG: dihydrolipoyl dehydrogenase [Bacteroidales bacterium]|nr:dihydrolipoyl dehydrogenase [Bacteroidales bacterium]